MHYISKVFGHRLVQQILIESWANICNHKLHRVAEIKTKQTGNRTRNKENTELGKQQRTRNADIRLGLNEQGGTIKLHKDTCTQGRV